MVVKFYETIKEVKVDKSMLRTEPWETPTLREQKHKDERRQRSRRNRDEERNPKQCEP